MRLRTVFVLAVAATGMSAMSMSPATAVVNPTASGPSAQATNPCSFAPQAGGGFAKISGPGPDFEGSYAIVAGKLGGSCVKVRRGQQSGTYTHRVVVSSGGNSQATGYNRAWSDTRLPRKAGSRCTVVVTVRIAHTGRHTGVYQGTIKLDNCTL